MNETLFVKNMVCNRCIMAIEEILKSLNIPFSKVKLGEIDTERSINETERQDLDASLRKIGFSLISNKGSNTIEKIKQITTCKARNQLNEKEARLKLSTLLSDKLHYEYSYLSNLFSSIENRTIESYFIEQRIEYAKELLVQTTFERLLKVDSLSKNSSFAVEVLDALTVICLATIENLANSNDLKKIKPWQERLKKIEHSRQLYEASVQPKLILGQLFLVL